MTAVLLVDAGGVLFNNVTEETDFVARLAERHHADPAQLRREIDGRDYDYEVDARHVYDVLGDCLAKAGAATGALDREWTDALYLRCVRPYSAVHEYLGRLRATRPQLRLVLANNEASHFDRLKDRRYGHLRLFDVIGSSWRVGAVKPDAEYFSRLLEISRGATDEVLLVDDNPEVIASAAEQGVPGLLVLEPAALPERLDEVLTRWG